MCIRDRSEAPTAQAGHGNWAVASVKGDGDALQHEPSQSLSQNIGSTNRANVMHGAADAAGGVLHGGVRRQNCAFWQMEVKHQCID